MASGYPYLLISSAEKRSIAGHTDTENSSVFFWNQLVGADTLSQVPDTNHTSMVTTDEFTLVWVDHHIVDRRFVHIVALQTSSSSIPNFHSSILRTGDHPLSFTVKCDASDIVGVTLKCDDGIGVGRFDIKKLDIVVTSRGQETLVRGNAKTIDLRVGVLNGTRANAGERLPEAADPNLV